MNYVTDFNEKIELIKKRFGPLIGEEIKSYGLPQLWVENENAWGAWNDLPLFLTIGVHTLSISWIKFDDLAIEEGRMLPFSPGLPVRWLKEGDEILDKVVGKLVMSVFLGRGEMSVAGREIEIWTRVLLLLNDGNALDIFNAFDENGFELFSEVPGGDFIDCTNPAAKNKF